MAHSIMPDRRTGALLLTGLLAVAAPVASAASPQRTVIAWSTYLRSGPGQSFAAIAELEHDAPVAVGACDGGWCRVSTADANGFVDRDALTLPRTPAPQPAVQTDCTTTLQADNRGSIPTRFCSAPPKAR